MIDSDYRDEFIKFTETGEESQKFLITSIIINRHKTATEIVFSIKYEKPEYIAKYLSEEDLF